MLQEEAAELEAQIRRQQEEFQQVPKGTSESCAATGSTCSSQLSGGRQLLCCDACNVSSTAAMQNQ